MPVRAQAHWSREPRWSWCAVIAAALLLIARKPWALTTPQLWAEDGPIHLADNDEWGAGAFFVPYRGYLHLLPRLIAWFAGHVADVASAPAIYAVAAFLIAVGLFARLASARIDLPGKPWLILSFVLAAHTGEVWFNITNLHWLTAFFLVLQAVIARPTTAAQRCGDLAILAVVGLTGPFIVVFLPLLMWRWWRDRHADNLLVLLTALTCAAVQVYFIKTQGPHLAAQDQPLKLTLLLAVIGSRFVVWPLGGAAVAEALPWPALGFIGLTFIGALLAWALRPDARRPVRAPIVGAFVAIAGVCLWRIRPDTWAYPDLVNGDSYFYIPRILLLWLLIWEFDASPRPVAIAARTLALIGVALQLPRFTAPTPPDYRWADYCDAIRRGDPAKIPTLPEGFVFDYLGRPRGAKPPATAIVPLRELPVNTGRLVNFSVRTNLAAGEPSFTVGVVVGGVGAGGPKPFVVRAAGPSLAALGIAGALPDPELVITQGDVVLAANDNWASGGGETLTQAFRNVGAFPFASEAARDAALVFTPTIKSATSYTVRISGHQAGGTVLAELYDATPTGAFTRVTPRLINFSVLKPVAAGDMLMAGFVIGGTTSQTVLVRAIGPTLGTAFGVGGAMSDPRIDLFDANRNLIAANNDWDGDKRLVAAFGQVAAFKLSNDSKDAALLLTLRPGTYNAQISGHRGVGGTVLVEVYEVPPR